MIVTISFALLVMYVGAASTSSVQSCLFLPNVDLHEGTVHEFDTSNIKDCCVACSSNTCCVAYTYDKEKRRCYLKNSIGYSSEDSSKTSGLKPNAYFGKGVKLTNVKIIGDQSNTIELMNQEECKEYCTAYQVFTYTPPSADESSGECACSMRIKSLRYEFGCSSEITPPNQ